MQEKYTQKLFFSKYDHRVIIKCSSWNRQDSQYVHPAVIDYLLKDLEHSGFRMRYTEYYSYYKTEKPSFRTYYFSDPALLTFFQEKFGDHLQEVTRPKNKEHSEVLEKERVLVREKLFHGKYRYCIRTSARWIEGTHRSTTKHMNEMVQWCETHFKDRTKEDMYIYKGWTKNFFFNNPADVILFKLTWSEQIDRTERIMLVSELNENEDTDAERA